MMDKSLLIIGHRGAMGLAPENTAASFDLARHSQVDMIETDIQVTSDNQPIVHHDLTINGQAIDQLSLAQVYELKSDTITLEQLFQLTNPTPIYLEIKPGVNCQPIIHQLQNMPPDWLDQLIVASFDQQILRQFHKQLPAIKRAVNEKWSGVRAHHKARQVDAAIIAINARWLWSGFIKAAANGPYQLFTYTLNDPKKARVWAKLGLAGVITDYPNRFRPS